jgi:hypothetical protein
MSAPPWRANSAGAPTPCPRRRDVQLTPSEADPTRWEGVYT